ncbi:hypothetical protein [Flavicella sp.]|uniref:hypothetical protein n=1 Tax=Flavicella sp. TaxID=2957742 RepID=UPI00301AD74D
MNFFFSCFLFLISVVGYSQCAMCKAVVENSDSGLAEGVNNGIMYLMIFPYILVGVLGYTLYRYKKKQNKN